MLAGTTAALMMTLATSPATPAEGTLGLWVSDARGQPIHDSHAEGARPERPKIDVKVSRPKVRVRYAPPLAAR
jgi:hypothetical protein